MMRKCVALLLPILGLALLASCHMTWPTENVPPSVKFIQPQNGDTLQPGIYEMSAYATDNQQVDIVVFWVGTEMLGMLEYNPSDTYRLTVDAPDGSYQLRVEADDHSHNRAFDYVTVHFHR